MHKTVHTALWASGFSQVCAAHPLVVGVGRRILESLGDLSLELLCSHFPKQTQTCAHNAHRARPHLTGHQHNPHTAQ